MATIFVPANWRVFTENVKLFEVDAPDVRSAIEFLADKYPALRPRMLNAAGAFVSFINIYVNDTDIRALQLGDTPLAADSELRIIPALAGG